MRLIGLWCKHGDMFSLQVLIGRGLDLISSLLIFASLYFLYSIFRVWYLEYMIAGAYGYEVPPVPIPNTEVKLIHAEDTQMVTSRENRAAPALIIFTIFLNSSVGRAHDC